MDVGCVVAVVGWFEVITRAVLFDCDVVVVSCEVVLICMGVD